MAEITVIAPVLNRPFQAVPLMDSVFRHATVDTSLLFVCTDGDDDEVAECERLRLAFTDGSVDVLMVQWQQGGRGDYARKINAGLEATTSPFVFTAADDIRFQAGWDKAALRAMEGAGVGVVGTDDLCNPRTQGARKHSTHSLVRREYAEQHGTIDGPGILHEGYWHNFVDDEMVATARVRRAYAASTAVVKHRHPLHDKTVARDDTYRIGLAHFDDDRQTYLRRTSLWARTRRSSRQR